MEKPATADTLPQEPKTAAKEPWEIEWEKTIEEAKKEGRVTLYSTAGPEARDTIYNPFIKKFGIEFDIVSGKGAQLTAKLLAEARAGLHLADIYTGGPTNITFEMKPAGLLTENLDKTFILPEVKDSNLWYKYDQMWADNERTHFRFLAYGSGEIAINTNLVMPGEIKTLQDLLNPKWKGKIIISDPTVSGAGSTAVAVVAYKYGWDFWRKLVTQQEPLVIRDEDLMIRWLAMGKYAIVTGPKTEAFDYAREAGAPIERVRGIGGVDYISGHLITLFKRAPHPNAAKVLINWLLSKEGQELYSKGNGKQSAREDIKVEGIASTRQPGIDYVMTHHEDFGKITVKLREEALEIFGPLIK